MVESSDLQSAIQRTQAMERVQQLQNQQEELNRKRFELDLAKQRAEKGKKISETEKAEQKRVVRDRYESEGEKHGHPGEPGEKSPGEEEDDGPEEGRKLDVRV
jgi:hypothetical protein